MRLTDIEGRELLSFDTVQLSDLPQTLVVVGPNGRGKTNLLRPLQIVLVVALPTAGGGVLFSLPAGWTDVAAADPFVVMAGGRCPFTAEGLLALAELIGRQRSQREGDDGAVKRITP